MMASLPQQFAYLEPFVPVWAHATENARSEKRWTATAGEFDSFYHAMIGPLDDVLDYLDRFEIGAMPPDVHKLYHLALAFAEASPHVEMYKSRPEVPNSFDARRFVAAHGDVEE